MYGPAPELRGDEAFKLYDTFGLPRDFIEDACRDQGIRFDSAGFDRAMEQQRKRAQASWKGAKKATASPLYQSLPRTEFEGYQKTLTTGARNSGDFQVSSSAPLRASRN